MIFKNVLETVDGRRKTEAEEERKRVRRRDDDLIVSAAVAEAGDGRIRLAMVVAADARAGEDIGHRRRGKI